MPRFSFGCPHKMVELCCTASNRKQHYEHLHFAFRSTRSSPQWTLSSRAKSVRVYVGRNRFFILPPQSKMLPVCCPSLTEMTGGGGLQHGSVKRPLTAALKPLIFTDIHQSGYPFTPCCKSKTERCLGIFWPTKTPLSMLFTWQRYKVIKAL